jgi:hypothetical protein
MASAPGRRRSFVSELSRADVDGDLADWQRLWDYCKVRALPCRAVPCLWLWL